MPAASRSPARRPRRSSRGHDLDSSEEVGQVGLNWDDLASRGHAWSVDAEELLGRVPRQLAVSSQRPEPGYEIAEDLIATHGGPDGPVTHTLVRIEGIAVRPAAQVSGAPADPATIGPVYRRMPGGALVVPTGRVLVRFAEGEPAERHRQELAEAGYDIEEVLSYAPHAAWLRARGGDIGDSLSHLDRLTAQTGIENVEPQMLGEVSRRD